MQFTLAAILVGVFLTFMDQLVVSTIIPILLHDLGGTTSLAFLVTAYLVASTVVLPIAGRWAEISSPKRIYLGSVLLFLLGSTVCGLAPDTGVLVLGRVIQGLGGAGMSAVAGTLLGLLVPPRDRVRWFGYFGVVMGVAGLTGPLLGGLLCDRLGWRSVFFVNLVPGAVILYLVGLRMPPLPSTGAARMDRVGAVSLMAWSIPLMLAASWGQSRWSLPLLGLAAVGLIVFIQAERATAEPLLDLRLLARPVFTLACLATFVVQGIMVGSILFLPLYLVEVRNLSALQAGLSILPMTFCCIGSSLLVGKILTKWGRGKPLLLAGALGTLVMLLVAAHGLTTHVPLPALYVVLAGLGLSLGAIIPILPTAAQSAVGPERMGTATSVNQFAGGLGATLVTALMGAVLASALHRELPRQLPPVLAPLAAAGFVDESELRTQLAQRVALLQASIAAQDRSALSQENLLTPELRAAVLSGQPLSELKDQLEAHAQGLQQALAGAVDETLTAAVRDVLRWSAGLAALALLLLLAMPEALAGAGKPEPNPES